MTLVDLIQRTAWPEVKAALAWLYPDSQESWGAYRRVYFELRRIAPSPTSMRLSIQTTFREDLDDEPFQEVVGRNGTRNRELRDFKFSGEAPDSVYALSETEFSLELEPWSHWLGMKIERDTQDQYATPEIIGHCLWEITFHGFTQAQIREEREELQRRVNELDTMTEDERKQYLIPAEDVFKNLDRDE